MQQAGRDSTFSWALLSSPPKWSLVWWDSRGPCVLPSLTPFTPTLLANLAFHPPLSRAWPDGRGADGLFESFPFEFPQDSLKGKPWKSLFYFGPRRASSRAHTRRGCAGGNCSSRRVPPEGPRGNTQHEIQTTTLCPPSWSTCPRHFKHFTSPPQRKFPPAAGMAREINSAMTQHEPGLLLSAEYHQGCWTPVPGGDRSRGTEQEQQLPPTA